MDDTAHLLVRREGRIARLVVSNPSRRNAATLAIWQAFPPAIRALSADTGIRAVVIEGAGTRDFMSGADISEFHANHARADAILALERAAIDAWDAVWNCPKPTVAAIHGYCLGGGLALAVCCDIRLAAEDAMFGIPAVKLGAGYRADSMKRLRRLVGPAYAKEMLLTGRQFRAGQAWRMGLLNSVVEKSRLFEVTAETVGIIAGGAPLTVAAVKLIDRGLDGHPEEQDASTWEKAVQACFASGDFIEGCAAFAERRAPVFSGR
ncbi:MAG: enoyl-CoA hydratase [Burkholderiaceae bacterium]